MRSLKMILVALSLIGCAEMTEPQTPAMIAENAAPVQTLQQESVHPSCGEWDLYRSQVEECGVVFPSCSWTEECSEEEIEACLDGIRQASDYLLMNPSEGACVSMEESVWTGLCACN